LIQQDALSAALRDFARTLAADYPIQRILDHLVDRVVDVLPVTAAGLTVVSEGVPSFRAGSQDSADRLEALQTSSGDGPSLRAVDSGRVVSIPDLRSDDRFPEFSAAAIAAGHAAVFSFPLRQGENGLGALSLYRDRPGALDLDDLSAAQTLADVAAAYLLSAQARDEARAASDYFRHTALHDALTGLPNRLLLRQRVEHAAQRARRSRTNAAVLFVDLDRFKAINDLYGHQVGDDLLVAVAGRLSALVRPGDTLARFAGDEFVFLCEDLSDADAAESLANRVKESFGNRFVLDGVEIAVTASVGMAFAGPGQDITEQMLVDADIAMYQAKRRGGGGHHVFDLRESLRTSERISMERDLRLAFGEGRLRVVYQPIVRSVDGRITAVEALLRWKDPVRGRVAPLAMLAVAEQSGLISEIGTWVLERACRDRADWREANPDRSIDLAVNVSARQLLSPDFCAIVADVLADTEMDASALILEVTEHAFIEDSERAETVLGDLRDLGVRLALDDFGTGYSSLNHLAHLPLDIVKMDKALIAGIEATPDQGGIVAALANLAHEIGLAVVAEGVETERQRDAVVAMACESSQGFFFARPMSAGAMGRYLSDGSSGVEPYALPIDSASA
jgi:diguanylate cyclase (GGDEF)-like protein